MLPAELPVGVLSGIGNQPQENASESQTQGQLTSLLSCAVDGQLERSADESDNQGQEGQPQTVRRRRKRRGMAGSSTGGSKRPREQPAESQATAASAQVAGKFRVSRSRYVDCSSCKLTLCFKFLGSSEGTPPATQDQPTGSQEGDSDPYNLAQLRLEKLTPDVFPTGAARESLFRYFEKHAPRAEVVCISCQFQFPYFKSY